MKTKIRSPHESMLIGSIQIHLIKEELKSRKLFESLRQRGLDNRFYQAELQELIMASIGLPMDSPDFRFCRELLDKHSQRVVEDRHELMNEARRVYDLLIARATPFVNNSF